MQAQVTHSKWLGQRKDHWHREIFPSGMLNERHLRTLFSISDKGRRVVDLSPTSSPAIVRLTDEITEVRTRFGHNRDSFSSAETYIWMDPNGGVLAVVEEKYEGPTGVHKPGDKWRKWAVAYLRKPNMGAFDPAEEITYDQMWGLGQEGAIDKVRQFIRDTWVINHETDTSTDQPR